METALEYYRDSYSALRKFSRKKLHLPCQGLEATSWYLQSFGPFTHTYTHKGSLRQWWRTSFRTRMASKLRSRPVMHKPCDLVANYTSIS